MSDSSRPKLDRDASSMLFVPEAIRRMRAYVKQVEAEAAEREKRERERREKGAAR